MELHKRLVDLRKEKGLSQEELAEKLYVSRQTISNWERGRTYPDINSLLLIATFFDVSLDNLIKGDVDIMKHQVKQTQLKKWLLVVAAIVFIWNVLAPIGRFYPIPNFEWISSAFLIAFILVIVKIYKLAKEDNLRSYSQIIAFIEGKEKLEKPTVSSELKYAIFLVIIFWLLVTLGQTIGSLLFFN